MHRPGLVGPPPSRPFDRPLRAMQLHDRMQSAGKLTICPRKVRKEGNGATFALRRPQTLRYKTI